MSKSNALSTVSRTQLEKAALSMRRRARNADMDTKRMKQRLVTVVVGGAAAFGVGYYMGKRQLEGKPTKWSGVDMEPIVGAVATIAGIGLQGKTGGLRKLGEYLESAGMGTIAFYAGSQGELLGSKAEVAA